MAIISSVESTDYKAESVVVLENIVIPVEAKGLQVIFTREDWPEGDCVSLTIELITATGKRIIKGPNIFAGGVLIDKFDNIALICSCGIQWLTDDFSGSWCEAERDQDGKFVFKSIGEEKQRPVFRTVDSTGKPKEQPIILHQPNIANVIVQVLQPIKTSIVMETR